MGADKRGLVILPDHIRLLLETHDYDLPCSHTTLPTDSHSKYGLDCNDRGLYRIGRSGHWQA